MSKLTTATRAQRAHIAEVIALTRKVFAGNRGADDALDHLTARLGELLVPDNRQALTQWRLDCGPRSTQPAAVEGDVAEWVGLHYGVNYSAESAARQSEWRDRYTERDESELGE
jgi:hypothetical protein